MFVMLGVVGACVVILAILGIRLATRRRLSRRGWIAAAIVFLPVPGVIGAMVGKIGTEYNPNDASLQRIAGDYTNGDRSLNLRMDGTYSSSNLKGLGSGTWSHFDWNLTFTGSSVEQPRWIIRRGRPTILPYYSGADGSDGLALTKK